MTREELLAISEYKNYTYEDYMCNQPMRDGEEMRSFFADMREVEEQNHALIR